MRPKRQSMHGEEGKNLESGCKNFAALQPEILFEQGLQRRYDVRLIH